jgi:hypothetical protein
MEPFIFSGRHTNNVDRKREAHRAECKRRNLPVVAILARRKYAYVFIDSLTRDTPLSEQDVQRIELLFGEFGEDGGRLILSPSRCCCDRVRIEDTVPLAHELWRVATQKT